MKRFAAHYLFLPAHGYLKQHVIEMEDERIVRLFPLTEEVASAEWQPGVIALFTQTQLDLLKRQGDVYKQAHLLFSQSHKVLSGIPHKLFAEPYTPCLLFPFDFTAMQPVAETQHRLLR